MNTYSIQDGDTVVHETIDNGNEMPVVDVDAYYATCQLSDGTEQSILKEELRVVKKTGGRFFDPNEDLTDLLDKPV